MSTPDRRARDQDRDAAIEVVEAAWADGQIVEADRDKRVEELLRAHTLQEIDLLVRDLQRPAAVTPEASAGPVPATGPVPGGFEVRYGSSESPDLEEVVAAASTVVAHPRAVGLVVAAVVLGVVATVVVGIVAVVNGVRGAVDSATSTASALPSTTPLPGESPEVGVNLFTREGYDELLADLDRGIGSTEAFEAVLYPTYAVVYVPVDATTRRSDLYYWNGTLDDLDSRTTATEEERLDLREVDTDVVNRLVRRVRAQVDEPTSWYAILRAPDGQDGAAIWAYASNDYQETVYVGAEPDGTIVYDSTKH